MFTGLGATARQSTTPKLAAGCGEFGTGGSGGGQTGGSDGGQFDGGR